MSGNSSEYRFVVKSLSIRSLLPKQRCSPQVSNSEFPLSSCRNSEYVEDPVASHHKYTVKRDSSQSLRAHTTQATSHRSLATWNASGWFHFSENDPGIEYVRWKVADSSMWRLTHGRRGLNLSFCARQKSRFLYSATSPCASQQCLKSAPLCKKPSPQIQHITGGLATSVLCSLGKKTSPSSCGQGLVHLGRTRLVHLGRFYRCS